jgi:hypothetical protein
MKSAGKFTMEKKLVVQVRYYEHLFIIRDGEGERVFTGSDEKIARRVKAVLESYYGNASKKKRTKPARKR